MGNGGKGGKILFVRPLGFIQYADIAFLIEVRKDVAGCFWHAGVEDPLMVDGGIVLGIQDGYFLVWTFVE